MREDEEKKRRQASKRKRFKCLATEHMLRERLSIPSDLDDNS